MVQNRHRARGVKVLKAVSSPLRLQILSLLFDKGALSYTELMNSLKMNPSRDAGKFAYHLKFLLKADLIEADAETKKYCLTDLGKMVLEVADRVEKKVFKPKGMLVRTSHFMLEAFDANKIANSLIKEAKVPPELAKKVAMEAEKRLRNSKAKYITAPLVREVVNTILVEKGFEDYRHKLTRLGMPVHEVSNLINAKGVIRDSTGVIIKAGKTLLGEYTLLNVFPRDIADAHLSGAIHVKGIGTWILKPSEVMHDMRFFFQRGLKQKSSLKIAGEPPQSFESALSVAFNVILHCSREIEEMQTFNYFNVFLAPYIKGVKISRIKKQLSLFIGNVNQHINTTLGLELSIPKFIEDKIVIGPHEKAYDRYGDFTEESLLLASLVIEIFMKKSFPKPMLNPKLVVKLNKETLLDEDARTVLSKAHSLVSERGVLYFANTSQKTQKHVVFSASGCKLETDLTGDWETDTLRTGCLGMVTINLPRIVHESGKDKNKFFEILKERFELVARAIKIKHRAIKQNAKHVLPFMAQNSSGDSYFRFDNCSRIINLAGFTESLESFCGYDSSNKERLEFADEIAATLAALKRKFSRRYGKRLFPAIMPNREASVRLAQLDIEKYGVAKVKFSGTRESPFYSTARRLKFEVDSFSEIPSESLVLEQKLRSLSTGGHLNIIELENNKCTSEELMTLTKNTIKNKDLEFFTYSQIITYCDNCKKSWLGILHKCPSCGAISTLMTFDRFAFT